jgi:hypothetical protein
MDHEHPRPTNPSDLPLSTRPTIWHTPPADRPGDLSADLSRRLLETFTHVGNVIVDIDNDATLTEVAAATQRHLHSLGGNTHPGATAGHIAHADLVMLRWPRAAAINPRHLLQSARDLLTPTGVLVIVVRVPTTRRTAHLSALIGAAHTAGMQTVRHIVAITPTRDTPGTPTPSRTTHPHTDLLVLRTRRP